MSFTSLRPSFVTFVAYSAFLVVAIGSTSPAAAQQPGRAPLPREARGVVKSVDAKTRAITVTTADFGQAPAEKKFTLAKDAEIALGDGTARRSTYKSGRLDDLAAGTAVTLTLSDDEKSATSVLAQGPLVRGVLKRVDADKKRLVVTLPPAGREASTTEETYQLADDAEIGVDDGRGRRFSVKEGKLADLTAGSLVSLQLSASQKEVQFVVAEGASLNGLLRSIDAAGKKLTVALNPSRPGEEPEECTLDVAGDAVVLLDDGRGRRLSLTSGKLSDVPVGSFVRVRLSGDQKQAVQLTAEGPNRGGMLKNVDAEKRTVTVARFLTPGQEPEEITLPVAEDARIVIDNQPAKLDEIRPADNGPFANLRLSLDQKTVQAISIFQNR